MAALTTAARNKMAATYGILAGLVSILLTTVAYMLVGNMVAVYSVSGAGLIVSSVVLGVLATRIRKANGGYLEFREAFGAVFVMILVSTVMLMIYNFIYIKAIDPDYALKTKAATLEFMEQLGSPEEALDATAAKFDEQIETSKKFNLGNNLLAFVGALTFNSLIGLIVAAIVKKKRPVFDGDQIK